jgi:glutathione-regulated potassium-efflux system ancillary protein KefG
MSPSRHRRVLILFAHPALERSRVNRRLIGAVSDLDGVTVHDLYEAYPDFEIDVPRDQALCAGHDLIIFQHPFYWYSTPALMKEWMDLVLEFGWAYGPGGDALAGKEALSVITTGGGEETYCEAGGNHFTIRQFLAPVEQTARLCGMSYLAPLVVHGTHRIGALEIEAAAAEYRDAVIGLRDNTYEIDPGAMSHRLNRVRSSAPEA